MRLDSQTLDDMEGQLLVGTIGPHGDRFRHVLWTYREMRLTDAEAAELREACDCMQTIGPGRYTDRLVDFARRALGESVHDKSELPSEPCPSCGRPAYRVQITAVKCSNPLCLTAEMPPCSSTEHDAAKQPSGVDWTPTLDAEGRHVGEASREPPAPAEAVAQVEYKTTTGMADWSGYAEAPVPPDPNDWELVGTSAATLAGDGLLRFALFWTWRRTACDRLRGRA
jgi:hypothetical protein